MNPRLNAKTTLHNSEPFKIPDSFTLGERKKLFREIQGMYDRIDDVMASTQLDNITNRAEQLALALPFVTQATYSVDIISAFYVAIVFNGHPVTQDVQDTVETAFRNVFYAMKDFLDGAEATLLPAKKAPEEIDPQSTTVVAVDSVQLPTVLTNQSG